MSWADELQVIRAFLRDPKGKIWSEAFLRHLYNDVQQDFQHKTHVLEGVTALRVPQFFQFCYQHDWEWRHLPEGQSQFYQCLQHHDDGVFCYRWETQQVTGISPDVSDYGVHFTQPWEAYMGETPGELVRQRFPRDFNSMRYIAYDEEPIAALTKKQVQSTDPSYFRTEGEPIGYFPYDEADNSYVLYPRPSASFYSDVEGEGMVLHAEGDTEDSASGTIAVRTYTSDVGSGVALDLVETQQNVFMVYSASPPEIKTLFDEPGYPAFLRKYIRYGVISRAYGANTDGRIRSLSDFWSVRYGLGIEFAKRFARNRRQDRDYRLTTKGLRSRRNYRHPRLPDTYPAVNP